MDPIIGAGILGGASSLLGSALNVIGAQQTNKTNKEIAQMNNQAMIDLMREQTRADQTYNSVGEQMKRAISAGVNPMLMAGAQPTSVSASAVPNLDTPVLQNPFNAVDLGGSAYANAVVQSKSLDNQSRALDIQDFESTTELLRVVGDLAKSGNLTSNDINDLISKFLPADRQSSLGPLVQDQYIKTKFSNAIETSNLDVKEKKYLFGWLDEMTNAQFTNLLADTELKQTNSNVNRSLSRLNDSKRREIEQAIKNMQEEWKSLNFQGELDARKLTEVAKISESIVKKLTSEASISEQEACYWVWNVLMQTSNKSFLGFTNRIDSLSDDINNPFN